MSDWVFTATCVTCGEAWQPGHKCSPRVERKAMSGTCKWCGGTVDPSGVGGCFCTIDGLRHRITELERQLAMKPLEDVAAVVAQWNKSYGELRERLYEMEQELAKVSDDRNRMTTNRDFWKGRSDLMQRQRDMRLAELTAKDAEIAALAAGLHLAHKQMEAHGLPDSEVAQSWGLDACQRALEEHDRAIKEELDTMELRARSAEAIAGIAPGKTAPNPRCPTCDDSRTVFDSWSAPCPQCAGKEASDAAKD